MRKGEMLCFFSAIFSVNPHLVIFESSTCLSFYPEGFPRRTSVRISGAVFLGESTTYQGEILLVFSSRLFLETYAPSFSELYSS